MRLHLALKHAEFVRVAKDHLHSQATCSMPSTAPKISFASFQLSVMRYPWGRDIVMRYEYSPLYGDTPQSSRDSRYDPLQGEPAHVAATQLQLQYPTSRRSTWIPCRQRSHWFERKSHDLEALFRTMGERLAPSGEKGRLQFRISDKSGNTNWVISLGGGGPKVETSTVDHPDLEILTQKETMLQMAEGMLTPTVAFYRGQMRVRGNVELGKRLLTHLGSPDGELRKPRT